LFAVALAGTAWFWIVEHWSFLDALQQTVTTITTVGLGEVRPFDDTAKIFSIFLSVVGVSAGLFTLGAVFEEQVEDTLDRYGRRRMDRRIAKLSPACCRPATSTSSPSTATSAVSRRRQPPDCPSCREARRRTTCCARPASIAPRR
jgi:hypothetical protein